MINEATPIPAERVRQLTGRDYISWSAISTYRACPLRYYYRYVARRPPERISASFVFGGAIHAALEQHCRAIMAGAEPPSLEALVDAYRDAWRGHDLEHVVFGSDAGIYSLTVIAERMLAAFRASPAARPLGSILGIEEELRGELLPGVPDLLARIDLLVDHGEYLTLTDFKTSRNRWSTEYAAAAAEQLLLYRELVGQWCDRPVRLEFVVLTKAQTPVVQLLPVTVAREQIARTKHAVARVWRAIEAEHFYPSPSPFECPACPYRQACQQWAG